MIQLFFLIFLITSSTQAEDPLRKLSLKDAKRFAVEHNFSVKTAQQDIEISDAKLTQSRAGFFPKLGIATGVDYFGHSKDAEHAGMGYGYLKYNLFNGFKDRNSYLQFSFEKEAAEAKFQKAKFDIGLEVEKLFYNFLLKKEEERILTHGLEINAKHRQLIQRRQSAGLLSSSDLMAFELRESHLKSEITAIKQDLLETKVELLRALGPDAGKDIEPVGSLPHEHIEGSLEEYLNLMRTSSAQLKESTALLSASDAESSASRSGWMPAIELEAIGGNLDLDNKPEQGGVAFRGKVLAKWEFFSGGETSGILAEAKAKQIKQEYELQKNVLDIMTKIEVLYRKLYAIQERVDIEEKNEERAKKLYNALMSEYSRGIKNSLDVESGEEEYIEAQLRRQKLKHEFLLTRLEFEKALGTETKIKTYQETHSQ